MDAETRLSGFGLALLGGLLAVAVVFAVHASVGDRVSEATALAPVDPSAITRLASDKAAARANAGAKRAPRNAVASGMARAKLSCAGCRIGAPDRAAGCA